MASPEFQSLSDWNLPDPRKGPLTVEASNSHGTYFVSDITTLRAESRLALAVYRPSAFVAVIGLA
jgi:hypothetical protein